jgi:hypothetical protein
VKSAKKIPVSAFSCILLRFAYDVTVPDDYDDLLSYYTKRGYRVIAMAGKSIESLSWLRAQKMKRCELIRRVIVQSFDSE